MIEKLSKKETVKLSQTVGGQRELLREQRNKIDELIDSVNDHEDMIYGSGCANDDDGNCGCGDCPTCLAMNTDQDHLRDVMDLTNGVDDICPDCRAKRDLPDLQALTDEQLQQVRSRTNYLLEERSQASMMDNLKADDCDDKLPTVDTTDGLFGDFTEFVAAHPGLRFWQSLANWSGYTMIYGAKSISAVRHTAFTRHPDLEDTYHKTTKGPRS